MYTSSTTSLLRYVAQSHPALPFPVYSSWLQRLTSHFMFMWEHNADILKHIHNLFFNHGAHSCFQLDSSLNLLLKAQKCLFCFIFLDKELLLLYSIFIIVKQSALTENSHTHALTHKRLIKTVQFSLGQHFYIKKDWRCMLEEIDRIGGMLSNKVALRFLFWKCIMSMLWSVKQQIFQKMKKMYGIWESWILCQGVIRFVEDID